MTVVRLRGSRRRGSWRSSPYYPSSILCSQLKIAYDTTVYAIPDPCCLNGLPKFTITLEAFPYPRESNRGSVDVAPGRATFSAARAPRHSSDAPGHEVFIRAFWGDRTGRRRDSPPEPFAGN